MSKKHDLRLTCANVKLQVECVKGKCATGGRCSNQAMQDGVGAFLAVKPRSGKGMSLMSDQQIDEGTFVCQYTGEVVSRAAYRRRQQVR